MSKLPGLEKKVRVAIDWTLDLFFSKNIVQLPHLLRRRFRRRKKRPYLGDHDRQSAAETDKRGHDRVVGRYRCRRKSFQPFVGTVGSDTQAGGSPIGAATHLSQCADCASAQDGSDDARSILTNWAGQVSDGMLPNRFPDDGQAPKFDSVMLRSWFIFAVHDLFQAAEKAQFDLSSETRELLCSAIGKILDDYLRGRRHGTQTDPTDGLFSQGKRDYSLHGWMRCRCDCWPAVRPAAFSTWSRASYLLRSDCAPILPTPRGCPFQAWSLGEFLRLKPKSCKSLHEHPPRARTNRRRQRPHRRWKRWGPYLSERQWATVREDYSEWGNCWDYFPHDHARSRAYRWSEDGLLGFTDHQCRLCFALALWNEKDPILKERLFGLTGSEGNHGEDVKEQYFYLAATPTYSYAKRYTSTPG